MINRIDLFMPPVSQYGVLNYFTKKLHDALMRNKVQCRLLVAERKNPKPFLESVFVDKPNCTLSFNGLLPDNEGRFFCDMIKIPHLAYVVDSPYRFLSLTQSPRSMIGCMDLFACKFLSGMGFDRCCFLPHAVDKDLCPALKSKRKFDVVMLTSLIDYEGLKEKWREKYPLAVVQIMIDTAEISLREQNIPIYEAFVKAINQQQGSPHTIDPKTINHAEIMNQIETYVKGRDRVELLRAITDSEVHLFGADSETATWKDYVGDQKNIHIHPPVPYEEALEIMQKSKIVLNSCAWIRHGAHERIFSAMACEAVSVTAENPFLSEYYTDQESVLFYHYGKWGEVNQKINAILDDDAKRQKLVEKAREITMRNHTWDHRAKDLLDWLEPKLQNIEAEPKES